MGRSRRPDDEAENGVREQKLGLCIRCVPSDVPRECNHVNVCSFHKQAAPALRVNVKVAPPLIRKPFSRLPQCPAPRSGELPPTTNPPLSSCIRAAAGRPPWTRLWRGLSRNSRHEQACIIANKGGGLRLLKEIEVRCPAPHRTLQTPRRSAGTQRSHQPGSRPLKGLAPRNAGSCRNTRQRSTRIS